MAEYEPAHSVLSVPLYRTGAVLYKQLFEKSAQQLICGTWTAYGQSAAIVAAVVLLLVLLVCLGMLGNCSTPTCHPLNKLTIAYRSYIPQLHFVQNKHVPEHKLASH